MDNYLIYEDDNYKIEIDGKVHQYLKSISIDNFTLEDRELEIILSFAFEELNKNNIKLNKPILIKNIPFLKSGRPLSLKEPYDIYNEVIAYISLFPNLDDKREAIIEDINDLFKEQNIFCYIFKRRIFDVKGFFIFKEQDKNDIVLFFGFKDGEAGELNLLDFLS